MTELARTRPESFFADRFNVTRSLLERVLGSNLIGRADDADIYLEYRVNEELQLEEGTVKKASRHVSQGAGVRALSGTRTGYAHTDDISLQNREEAARQARAIADRARLARRLLQILERDVVGMRVAGARSGQRPDPRPLADVAGGLFHRSFLELELFVHTVLEVDIGIVGASD